MAWGGLCTWSSRVSHTCDQTSKTMIMSTQRSQTKPHSQGPNVSLSRSVLTLPIPIPSHAHRLGGWRSLGGAAAVNAVNTSIGGGGGRSMPIRRLSSSRPPAPPGGGGGGGGPPKPGGGGGGGGPLPGGGGGGGGSCAAGGGGGGGGVASSSSAFARCLARRDANALPPIPMPAAGTPYDGGFGRDGSLSSGTVGGIITEGGGGGGLGCDASEILAIETTSLSSSSTDADEISANPWCVSISTSATAGSLPRLASPRARVFAFFARSIREPRFGASEDDSSAFTSYCW